MALQSMTGFARREGASGNFRWVWELRSVNGKSLDLRLRLPPGHERYEPEIRRLCAAAFRRGNIQISLSVASEAATVQPVVNEEALAAVLAVIDRLKKSHVNAELPRLDGLLNIRGVLEFREPDVEPDVVAARDAECLKTLSEAIADLQMMREGEGTALGAVIAGQLDAVEKLVGIVEADPSRSADAIRERLSGQVALLLENSQGLDPARLNMEAALLATKADLREEIDRLHAHIAATRQLIAKGGPIGRRLDFLAQEFNRETNTICSKSNAAAVTAAGLELKVVIDQFREQIQNLE
ncbi:MAG TPA: YicC/YloC family endoribonuclease [Pararhizobium sp.]|nr:YicC/YloC family endoribonuclease [Pararhizobium sp.]